MSRRTRRTIPDRYPQLNGTGYGFDMGHQIVLPFGIVNVVAATPLVVVGGAVFGDEQAGGAYSRWSRSKKIGKSLRVYFPVHGGVGRSFHRIDLTEGSEMPLAELPRHHRARVVVDAQEIGGPAIM